MIFNRIKDKRIVKKMLEDGNAINIGKDTFVVVEKIENNEDGKPQPIVVSSRTNAEGFRVYEPQRGYISEVVFDKIQRLENGTFFGNNNGREFVYIINENGQTGMDEHNFDYVCGEEGTTQKLLKQSPYQAHYTNKAVFNSGIHIKDITGKSVKREKQPGDED